MLDVYELSDEEYDNLVTRFLDFFKNYCEEMIFFSDKQKYKKIKHFLENEEYATNIALHTFEPAIFEVPAGVEGDLYIAHISFLKNDIIVYELAFIMAVDENVAYEISDNS